MPGVTVWSVGWTSTFGGAQPFETVTVTGLLSIVPQPLEMRTQ